MMRHLHSISPATRAKGKCPVVFQALQPGTSTAPSRHILPLADASLAGASFSPALSSIASHLQTAGLSNIVSSPQKGLLSSFQSSLTTKALAALSLFSFASQKLPAGVMKHENFINPVTYQQHLDLGKSFHKQVVPVIWENRTDGGAGSKGSGVLVGNRRCVLTAAHVIESAGRNLDPATDSLNVPTGINYLDSPGTKIPIVKIIKHPGRTGVGSGTDLALLILAHDFSGGNPAEIANSNINFGDIATIVGFGRQKTNQMTESFITGDICAGNTKIGNNQAEIFSMFSTSWDIPLMYNANNGDSGGGLFKNGKLYGTVARATTSGSDLSTHSVNLTLTENRNWIINEASKIEAIPYVPSLADTPKLSIEAVTGGICLKVDRELEVEGGRWALYISDNLEEWSKWQPAASTGDQGFTAAGPGVYQCVIPLSAGSSCFRLGFEAD